MKTPLPLQIILCLIIVLSASCASNPPVPAVTPTSAIEITSFPSLLKMDGINLEFSGYKIDDQMLTIGICFDPPSDRTWFLGDISLTVENQEFEDNGVSSSQTTSRADGFECETIIYYLNDYSAPVGQAELSIGRLEAILDDIEEQNCDNTQKNLDEEKTGIVITCDPSIVGHDSGFVVLEKPNSMSDEEAILVVLVASRYSDAIPLNWRFSFLIEKP
jgi:hypothetical protein